jgi:salicylate hydroxylase
MLEATSIQAQLADARGDRLRVLVVGAGVAGTTVAQLLRREGLHPVLVERSAREADSGYMLALMPLVDPVLETLGVGSRTWPPASGSTATGSATRPGRRSASTPWPGCSNASATTGASAGASCWGCSARPEAP